MQENLNTVKPKRKRKAILIIAFFFIISISCIVAFFIATGGHNPFVQTQKSKQLKSNKKTDQNKQQVKIEPDSNKPAIALTFDDGPSNETTPTVLDVLKQNNANATFFVLGKNAKLYPEILKRLITEGNELGNHTYSHCNLATLSPEKIQSEIVGTNQICQQITGVIPKFVRPPYGAGAKSKKVKDLISEQNQAILLWNVDTEDWKHNRRHNPNLIVEHVLKNAKDGDVILMHDIHPSTVEALKIFLPKLSKNFQIVTVSKLFQLKNKKIEPYETYFSIDNKQQSNR